MAQIIQAFGCQRVMDSMLKKLHYNTVDVPRLVAVLVHNADTSVDGDI